MEKRDEKQPFACPVHGGSAVVYASGIFAGTVCPGEYLQDPIAQTGGSPLSI